MSRISQTSQNRSNRYRRSHPTNLFMQESLRSIILITVAILMSACLTSEPPQAPIVQIGPASTADLVIYFQPGTSEEQISAFNASYVNIVRADGRGSIFRDGISGYLRLLRSQAHGYDAIAITFRPDLPAEQRQRQRDSMRASPIVYRIFENIAPDQINEDDSLPRRQ